MRPFACPRCQTPLYFENFQCTGCGAQLGFVPGQRLLLAFEAPHHQGGSWVPAGWHGPAHRACANRMNHGVCNWMLDADDPSLYCRSCRLNELIPDLTLPRHLDMWADMERAKRRALHDLLALGLVPGPKRDARDVWGLSIRIEAPLPGGSPVLTGHKEGRITLNLREADSSFREAERERWSEPWRTLLGHLRHELSHYLYYRWVAQDTVGQHKVYQVFGDMQADYEDALARHRLHGPRPGWQEHFVSAYASAHPHEDWAETCAHTLLVLDALDTAQTWGLGLDSAYGEVHAASLAQPGLLKERIQQHWLPLARFLNAMSRGLGLPDNYPFILPEPVLQKMTTVADVLLHAAAPQHQ